MRVEIFSLVRNKCISYRLFFCFKGKERELTVRLLITQSIFVCF